MTTIEVLRGRWNCKDFISKENDTNASNGVNACVANTTVETTCAQQPTPTTGQTTVQPTTVVTTATEQPPNGVAIDNKIEQAMDLVKSHLMFAVREEVDVLKERIKELESEIQILRAHSTPDVLQLVLAQQQTTGQQQQQNVSSNSSQSSGNQSQSANQMNE